METLLHDSSNFSEIIFSHGVSYDEKDGFRIDEDARALLAEKIAEISATISENEKQETHTVETLTPEVAAAVVDTMTYNGQREKKIKKFLTWVQKRISGKLDNTEKVESKIEKKLHTYIPLISKNLYIWYPDGTKESIPLLIHTWSDVGSVLHSFRTRKNFAKFLRKS